ncbi:hypothetical protein D3C75_232710 [compost metagenome]
MRKTNFTIMEWEQSFEGYTSGETWNGWACPYFTKEAGIKLCEYTRSGRYDEVADWFVFAIEGQEDVVTDQVLLDIRNHPDVDLIEDYEVYKPEEINVNGESLKVYGIGYGWWIWDEVEQLTLTEQLLDTMKQLMIEDDATAPDQIAQAVIDMIEKRDHPALRNSDQIYDAVHELASLLVADVGKYA